MLGRGVKQTRTDGHVLRLGEVEVDDDAQDGENANVDAVACP